MAACYSSRVLRFCFSQSLARAACEGCKPLTDKARSNNQINAFSPFRLQTKTCCPALLSPSLSPSQTSMGKRQRLEAEAHAQEQAQQEKNKKSEKRKGKQRAEDNGQLSTGYSLHRVAMAIPLAPIFASDIRKGVLEVLDRFVTSYVPCLGFVLLTYNADTLVVDPSVDLIEPTAMMLVRVVFEGLGWRPEIGSRIRARLAHSVQSHVSLIIHNTFNASIAADHLPKDRFRYDPDQADPHSTLQANLPIDDFYAEHWKEEDEAQARHRNFDENGKLAVAINRLDIESSETEPENNETEAAPLGCWVRTKSGKPIGDDDGFIIFTVIGLTMANHTISVHGSLLADPFSPKQSSGMPALPSASQEIVEDARIDIASLQRLHQQQKEPTTNGVTVEAGDEQLDPDTIMAVDHGASGHAHENTTVTKQRRKKAKANTTAPTVEPAALTATEKPAKKRRKKEKISA